jgi:membrane protein
MKEKFKAVRIILINSVKGYKKDDPLKLAGTTAYFTIFAIAPIFIIITAILGFFVNKDIIIDKIYEELNQLIGSQGTEFVQPVVENFQDTERNIIGTIIGVLVFLFASTTLFIILQNSLNYIWRIKSKPKNNLLKALKNRLLSFGLILSIGFILLVLLIIDAGLAFFSDFLTNYIDEYALYFLKPLNYVVSFAVLVLIFALIYRFLPDANIRWRVTWVGSIITAVLFSAGKYLIGIGLGATDVGLLFGAAGSAVIFILWVFYSSLILYFGAEVTKQYASYYNYDIRPKDYAVKFEISEVEDESQK